MMLTLRVVALTRNYFCYQFPRIAHQLRSNFSSVPAMKLIDAFKCVVILSSCFLIKITLFINNNQRTKEEQNVQNYVKGK